jgi:hypothetical protein
MNIRDWFVSRYLPCTEKDRDAARKLLAAGRRQALTGAKPLCAKHPALRSLADGPPTLKEAYDYYYTVAFAVMAMLGANMYFPEHKRRPTSEAIKAELESWRRDSYANDAHHLFSKLNVTSASAEAIVGEWLIEQVARKAGSDAETERLRELKKDEAMITALGNDILTQAAESVVAFCLEDKNK